VEVDLVERRPQAVLGNIPPNLAHADEEVHGVPPVAASVFVARCKSAPGDRGRSGPVYSSHAELNVTEVIERWKLMVSAVTAAPGTRQASRTGQRRRLARYEETTLPELPSCCP